MFNVLNLMCFDVSPVEILNLDGFCVIARSIKQQDEQLWFQVEQVFGLDDQQQFFRLFDNQENCYPGVTQGVWHQKTLILDQQCSIGHIRYSYRYVNSDPHSLPCYKFCAELSHNGQEWHCFLQGDYNSVASL